jgi:hypothetical protein
VRKSILIYICVSFFIFPGASPWEGSGVVAPAGELPETGFFIATNSYPRNTIVDITNLDTDKSTRVIVVSPLDSPGILAIVSREAAELIDMKAGVINRIRIVQPPEPIAYLRFKESITSGIPGYDSGNVITEETYLDDPYEPPVVVEYEITEPVLSGIRGPSYTLEPEWQDKEIVDVPFNAPPLPEPDYDDEYLAEDDYYYDDEDYEYIVDDEYFYENDEYLAEDEPDYEYDFYDDDEYIAEDDDYEYDFYNDDEYIVDDEYFYEDDEYIAEDDSSYEDEIFDESKEYEIVEAEERPPEDNIYGIDPDDIIPGIDRPSQVTETHPGTSFPAPRITELLHGRYYVQLTALTSPELIEDAVKEIDHRYEPVVFIDENNVYRLLLGPLNQGESAAMLQRFKSIGYNDAFVRYVR